MEQRQDDILVRVGQAMFDAYVEHKKRTGRDPVMQVHFSERGLNDAKRTALSGVAFIAGMDRKPNTVYGWPYAVNVLLECDFEVRIVGERRA